MLLAWHLKILAFKYDRVSRVSPIFYLESAFSLFIDIIVFHVEFSALQVVGLVLVIGVFLVIIGSAYLSPDETIPEISSNEKTNTVFVQQELN